MLYIQHYIKTVHFWLKYNGLAIVRKTTNCFKIQKVVTFHVFCRVSYVFSNYARSCEAGFPCSFNLNWSTNCSCLASGMSEADRLSSTETMFSSTPLCSWTWQDAVLTRCFHCDLGLTQSRMPSVSVKTGLLCDQSKKKQTFRFIFPSFYPSIEKYNGSMFFLCLSF